MNLLNLTIHNVGVFRGRHDFDFSPIPKPDGTKRHLTVITGQNGVGKSTVFQSLALALHGPLAVGSRMSRQAYNEFLSGRLHRYNGTGILVSEEEAGIKLGFQYTQSGKSLCIYVDRRWRSGNRTVHESFKVLRDGASPEIDPADYQAWVNELVPPGLDPICFFDAEHLDALASPEQQMSLLGHTLRGLLGLDLVEQLQADLERYTLLKSGGGRGLDRLRKEVQKCQSALRKCDAKLARLKASGDSLGAKERQIEAELAEQERRLAAKGGAYAARRPILEERLRAALSEIDVIEDDLRDQSAELLPFSLAPGLCQRLSERLIRENELKQQQAAHKLWRERISEYRNILKEEAVWQGLRVSERDRKILLERLMKEFRAMDSKGDTSGSFLHNLADTEREKLQGWITQALHTVSQQVRSMADRLRALRNEQRQIELDLQRAPDEEELMPIHAEISRLRKASVAARREWDDLKVQLGALQFKREELIRQLDLSKERLMKAQGFKQQLALAERSKATLRAYQESLTRQRLAELEKSLVKSFNTICRKEHLLERVSISPSDFSVQLQGESGNELNLADFSAGERELYSLALIQSLRQVSGRRLPVIIDTPLARLDKSHRQRFIRDYVPAVSDQVVLIATDAELGEQLLAEAEPYLARVYRLNYDQERKESFATMSEVFSAPSPTATFTEVYKEKAHVF
jgi:DNA sulfur modification protein DndD